MSKKNILITVILIVVYGVCICLIFLNLEKLRREETGETENNEIVKNGEVAENNEVNGWKNYESPWYADFEFQYPEEWGELLYDLGNPGLGGIYHFLPYQKIRKVWYHKPSNTLAFMERGEKCLTFGGVIKSYEETLRIIGQNKEVKTIIGPGAIKPPGGYCQIIGSISFSPDGKYIYFGISGYDNWEPMIVNIESGLNIIENYDIWFKPEAIYKDIIWSPDNKVLVIGSEWNGFSGEGSNAIFVSDYNSPEELTKIISPLDLDWGEGFPGLYKFKFDNLDFVNNNTLRFSLFFSEDGSFCASCKKEIIAKYEYNLQTKELKKTF